MELGELTVETFEPIVGDAFGVEAGPGAELVLVLEVAEAVGDRPGGRQPFRLQFSGPHDPLLPQAIHPLRHADLGALEIFIVAIGQGDEHTTYEAIFT